MALKKSADAIKTRPLGEGGGKVGGRGFATLIIALEYEWYVSAEHLEIAVGWVFFVFSMGIYLFSTCLPTTLTVSTASFRSAL